MKIPTRVQVGSEKYYVSPKTKERIEQLKKLDVILNTNYETNIESILKANPVQKRGKIIKNLYEEVMRKGIKTGKVKPLEFTRITKIAGSPIKVTDTVSSIFSTIQQMTPSTLLEKAKTMQKALTNLNRKALSEQDVLLIWQYLEHTITGFKENSKEYKMDILTLERFVKSKELANIAQLTKDSLIGVIAGAIDRLPQIDKENLALNVLKHATHVRIESAEPPPKVPLTSSSQLSGGASRTDSPAPSGKSSKSTVSATRSQDTSSFEKKIKITSHQRRTTAEAMEKKLNANENLSPEELLLIVKYLQHTKNNLADLKDSIELLESAVNDNVFNEYILSAESAVLERIQGYYRSNNNLVRLALFHAIPSPDESVESPKKSLASSNQTSGGGSKANSPAPSSSTSESPSTLGEEEAKGSTFFRSELGFDSLKEKLSVEDNIKILKYFQSKAPTADPSIPNLIARYTQSKRNFDPKIADDINKKAKYLPYLVKQNQLNVDIGKIEKVLTRTEAGGLYNLGNTCWFNSLIQSQFRRGSVYYEALQRLADLDVNSIAPDRQKYPDRAKKILQIINLLDEDPSIEANEQLYDQLKEFLINFIRNSRGLTLGGQSDAQEGFDKLIEFLGLSHIQRPSIQSGKTDAIDAVRIKMESQQQIGIGQTMFGTNSGLNNKPTISHTSLVSLEIDDGATTMQDLINTNSMVGEKVERTDDPSLKINYFYLEPDQRPPSEITFFMRRYGFNSKTFEAELISKPISIDKELRVPVYNKQGTKVERVLILKLRDVVFKDGPSADSGHYVSSKFEGDEATLYDDAHVSQKEVEDADRKSLLLTYKVENVIEDPSEIAKLDFKTVQQYSGEYPGLSDALSRLTDDREELE